MKTTEIAVEFGIPGWFKAGAKWKPEHVEREAAWQLYVELVTRIAVMPLDPDGGLLTEALASLYSLFPTTREILRQAGPGVSPQNAKSMSVGYMAVGVLNGYLRPFLTKWHPVLDAALAVPGPSLSQAERERGLPFGPALREDLERTRVVLEKYALALGQAAGAKSLLPIG